MVKKILYMITFFISFQKWFQQGNSLLVVGLCVMHGGKNQCENEEAPWIFATKQRGELTQDTP